MNLVYNNRVTKSGNVTGFQQILNDGWKEGFNIDWGSSDPLIQNSIKVITSPKGSWSPTDFLRGFKFVYKLSDTTLYWAILFVAISAGGSETHNNCNFYYFKLDSNVIVDSFKNGDSQIPGYNPSYQNNGKIWSVSSSEVGDCWVVFSGSKTVSTATSFSIEFSWVNTGYIKGSTVGASSDITAIGYNQNAPSSWGQSSYTTYSSVFNQFKTAQFTYTGTCQLQPEQDALKIYQADGIIEITDGKVSYGQTIKLVSTGNQVCLVGTDYSGYDSWVQDQATYNLINIENQPGVIFA